ncbi:ROK family transcriptional regulator [Rhizobium paknamense]|uniref:NBD/HSP70 family sugar kinase n=1 Tax=Rhizobium paknamense TaxID=1206817 RepID=A0ABU0IHQ1_9HYPH|nr:ROK family transcriptional regulator [Rhizobium paknamense]MDQ0456744.1 putative NBD/HSP70 family sugar kinase [Rhizobium paknamense]
MPAITPLRLARRTRRASHSASETPGISPTDIAAHNSRTALEILRRSGPQTRLELSARLQLTEPAIAGIMARLLEAGHVVQRKRSGGGRYVSTEYLLKPESAYALGLRWTAAGGKICLVDLSGRVVETTDFRSAEEVDRAIDTLLAQGNRRAGCRGLAIAVSADAPPEAHVWIDRTGGLPLTTLEDKEAALIAEHVLGVGECDGGIVVILVGRRIEAGLLFGAKPFRGEHGRAGNIGAMRTGPQRIPLDEVLNSDSFTAFMATARGSETEALAAWATQAAEHLKDAIIAIGGFLSPGLILIGGDLPVPALDAMIERVNRQTRIFIDSFSVPDLVRTHFPDGGTAEGAAMSIFLGDLLPEISRMGTSDR